MAITHQEFRTALSRFASGVTIVTSLDAEDRFHGITVSAFSSVSLDPPRVLICVDRSTGSHFVLESSQAFVVNVLSSLQTELSERFAAHISNKFEGVSFETGIDGIPVLHNCLANLECRVVDIFDGGDHSIFVGEIERSTVADGDPLIYFRGDYRKIIE